MFTEDQRTELSAKLDGAKVKTRSQAGQTLSYVEGWVVIAEANRIFGFDGWSRETVETRCVWEGTRTSRQGKELLTASYTAKVRVTVYAGDAKIVREGTGAGSGMGTDGGEAHESAIKEAETDAMKRAFMTFGNPFGLALYDKTQADVDRGPTPPRNGLADAAAESWAAWATGPDVVAWWKKSKLDLAGMMTVEEVSLWQKTNRKQIDALYAHAVDRHTTVTDAINERLLALKATRPQNLRAAG